MFGDASVEPHKVWRPSVRRAYRIVQLFRIEVWMNVTERILGMAIEVLCVKKAHRELRRRSRNAEPLK